MDAQKLFDDGHQWYVFGRDPEKPEKILDTNQYMIVDGKRSILLDPGGIEVFSTMLASVLKYVNIEHLTDLFASHQDPDIISSLGMWDQVLPNSSLHCSGIWEGFIRHFGMDNIEYKPIDDAGGRITLENIELDFIPAHYMHSSGNFNVYDPKSKILFSGDVGAALEPPGAPMFVDDFEQHVENMRFFHQRWMPSNEAKSHWIQRIRKLDIDILAPQHGRLFKGPDVQRFLDWFDQLDVGSAIK